MEKDYNNNKHEDNKHTCIKCMEPIESNLVRCQDKTYHRIKERSELKTGKKWQEQKEQNEQQEKKETKDTKLKKLKQRQNSENMEKQ